MVQCVAQQEGKSKAKRGKYQKINDVLRPQKADAGVLQKVRPPGKAGMTLAAASRTGACPTADLFFRSG
jgi:hypothetical protein